MSDVSDFEFEDDEQLETESVSSDEDEALPEEGIPNIMQTPRDKTVEFKAIKAIVVPPEDRITSHIIQPFEYSEVIATRAQQIAQNGRYFTEKKHIDPIQLAIAEFKEGRCPLIIHRTIGKSANGAPIVEQWKASELLKL